MSILRQLSKWAVRLQGRDILPPGIRVGKGVHIGDARRFDWSHGRHITIGDSATIAPGVRILCHDASSLRRLGSTWVAPVTIEKGAFIGAESVIMPGVTIGASSIVAAGSVVTKDVAPGTIVAGIPAREIGLVSELDEKRREQMSALPQFLSADYEREDLTDERAKELDEAVRIHGGYFLT